MNKKTLILLGLIGLFIIFLMCVLSHWRAIEKDIAECSNKILKEAQFSTLSAGTHDKGRSVLVSGTVESENAKQTALELLQDKCNMTDLESDIKIVIPKPTIKPYLAINFNENNELVNYTGKIAKTTVDQNIGFLLDKFKRAKNFKLGIVGNKDVIPAGYYNYMTKLTPYLSKINAADVEFDNNAITLKGVVASAAIKQEISSQLSLKNTFNTKIINLLEVLVPVVDQAVVYNPLNAVDCQKELSDLLSTSMVHFNTSSAVFKDDSIELLKVLAGTTQSCQKVSIEVIGHTDSSGNETSNIKLSKDRALAVVQYLLKAGVQTEKVSANGIGSSKPIATNATAEGRAQNRRIEFKVHSL